MLGVGKLLAGDRPAPPIDAQTVRGEKFASPYRLSDRVHRGEIQQVCTQENKKSEIWQGVMGRPVVSGHVVGCSCLRER